MASPRDDHRHLGFNCSCSKLLRETTSSKVPELLSMVSSAIADQSEDDCDGALPLVFLHERSLI